jgi:hypothetical protein
MSNDRLQVAVWFLLPIVGLLVLMVVIGFRGGLFILPPVIALLGVLLVLGWKQNRGQT